MNLKVDVTLCRHHEARGKDTIVFQGTVEETRSRALNDFLDNLEGQEYSRVSSDSYSTTSSPISYPEPTPSGNIAEALKKMPKARKYYSYCDACERQFTSLANSDSHFFCPHDDCYQKGLKAVKVVPRQEEPKRVPKRQSNDVKPKDIEGKVLPQKVLPKLNLKEETKAEFCGNTLSQSKTCYGLYNQLRPLHVASKNTPSLDVLLKPVLPTLSLSNPEAQRPPKVINIFDSDSDDEEEEDEEEDEEEENENEELYFENQLSPLMRLKSPPPNLEICKRLDQLRV